MELAEESVVPGLVDVIVKLGKSDNFPDDPGPKLPSGKMAPLVLIGEYPIPELDYLKQRIEETADAQGIPKRDFEWIERSELPPRLSKAGAKIITEELNRVKEEL